MSSLRPLFAFGTRPEAIKLAPLLRVFGERSQEITPIVCVSGQHREMLTQVLDYFGIQPDFDLKLMQPDQSLASLTARCVASLDETLEKVRPDILIVQGDTTTVMAASLAAFYRRVPVMHVEAGLRTGNLAAPFPEEFNRRATSLVAQLHCAPTERSAQNLLDEGIPPERVRVTGNTVVDALLWTLARERGADSPWSQKYAFLGQQRMVLVTGHRRENFGGGFKSICEAIVESARSFPEIRYLYPV
ncbi:MAG TPA: UDP-N-acetylglucosamine 2-epimerase (non-hydrolyzing), partial [Pirellulaceae bacterium]